MAKWQDKTGETRINNQGLKMTIKQYRNAMDIDVIFEDGSVSKHKHYDSFLKKKIAHPKTKQGFMIVNNKKIKIKDPRSIDHTGETIINQEGKRLTIIEYHNYKDMTVAFDDGKKIKHVSYSRFQRKMIKHPDDEDRVGETRKNNQGQNMTIIKYNNCRDITIRFDDGTELDKQFYNRFKNGSISHPKDKLINRPNIRIGETVTNTQGLNARIIKYNGYDDITVEFEDGTQRSGIRYQSFCNKNVLHPNLGLLRPAGTKKPKYAGKLFKTDIYGIAYTCNDITYYYCECPLCQAHEIWSFNEIKSHKCNQQTSEVKNNR